jgi:uncharacterized protein YutE (UPF0331/DUF86 family)
VLASIESTRYSSSGPSTAITCSWPTMGLSGVNSWVMRRAGELLLFQREIERQMFALLTSCPRVRSTSRSLPNGSRSCAQRSPTSVGLPCGSIAEFTSDRRNSWLADALLGHAIEALFDTAPHILAKVHGRGGLECRDVARLAVEHQLVSGGELADRLVKITGVRNRRIDHYAAVTPAELFTVLQCHLSDLEHLDDELQQSTVSFCRRPRHRPYARATSRKSPQNPRWRGSRPAHDSNRPQWR